MDTKDEERQAFGEKENPSSASGQVNTDDGVYVAGSNVHTGGDDFIGHDQNVQGDVVHGAKIDGDVIMARIGENAHNVFVGKNINITNIPRKPLERPPRAEHFVDRETALAQLLADLQPGRVVTLCGPGGIGKTALAAEAIWTLAADNEPPDSFPDGILFHSFYNQPQATLALEHIARSFGEESKPTPQAAAQRALAGQCALLILDGTENADDLRLVLDIHNRCGVLITSRQRKDAEGIRQEIAPLPPDDGVTLLQAWGGARAADEAVVRSISELVGRLPLALRLVGRYLAESEENAADYLTWLEQTPMAALDHGKRREQSVPLLLKRSLAQVSEQARQVLSIIGVLALAPFMGETIAVALNLSEVDAKRFLGELVNYGLLIRPDTMYEVTHALIHTYTQLHLSPISEVVSWLAIYYVILVNEHKANFTQLNALRPHVLAVLSACHKREAWREVDALARAIEDYLDLQGHWADRITIIERGITAAQALQDRENEDDWLDKLGTTYRNLGQYPQAIKYYQQALVIAQELGDRRTEGNCLANLGTTYRNFGQYPQALEYHQQALVIAQELSDRWGEAVNLGGLGSVYLLFRQYPQAIEYYQQALVIAQELGDRRDEAVNLGNLGSAYLFLEQYPQAIEYYQQALVIAQELGDRRDEAAGLGNLGSAYLSLEQYPQAVEYLMRAIAIAQEIGHRAGIGVYLRNLGNMYRNLKQYPQAIEYYQQALVIAQELGNRYNEGNNLGSMGDAYGCLKQYPKAIEYLKQALVIAQELGNRYNEGNHLGNLGNAYADLKQYPQAIEYYQQALVIAQELGDRQGEGNQLGRLGASYYFLKQYPQAIKYLKQTLVIAQELGDRHLEGNQLEYLGKSYHFLKQYPQAIEYYQQALVIAQELGDRRLEGNQLEYLGASYYFLKQHPQAIEYYQQALVIAQELGDRRTEGIHLYNLGNVYISLEQSAQARQAWENALRIFEEIKSPHVETVRKWLKSLEENEP